MAFLFIDHLTAYHYTQQIQSDGSSKSVRDSEPFISLKRCQISYEGDDNASPKGQAATPQQRGFKVFISGINTGLRRGDWIVIYRNGSPTYEGVIGEPKVYDRLIIHTECNLESWKKL